MHADVDGTPDDYDAVTKGDAGGKVSFWSSTVSVTYGTASEKGDGSGGGMRSAVEAGRA